MPFTHKFDPDSRIGRVMLLLAKPEGATLREIAAAYDRPLMPDDQVIRDILRSQVCSTHRVMLEVDLRAQRVRTPDHVRIKGVASLAELVVAGSAVEADFTLRAAYAEVLGPDDDPAEQERRRTHVQRPDRWAVGR